MWFSFNIIHVPGKNLITDDALSRVPLPAAAMKVEYDLEKECTDKATAALLARSVLQLIKAETDNPWKGLFVCVAYLVAHQ